MKTCFIDEGSFWKTNMFQEIMAKYLQMPNGFCGSIRQHTTKKSNVSNPNIVHSPCSFVSHSLNSKIYLLKSKHDDYKDKTDIIGTVHAFVCDLSKPALPHSHMVRVVERFHEYRQRSKDYVEWRNGILGSSVRVLCGWAIVWCRWLWIDLPLPVRMHRLRRSQCLQGVTRVLKIIDEARNTRRLQFWGGVTKNRVLGGRIFTLQNAILGATLGCSGILMLLENDISK